MKIKTGDNVKIIAGKDRGKTGKVIRVITKDDKILVEGVGIVKKHMKPRKQGEKGQIIQAPKPVHISNTMIVCSSCKKAVRISKKDKVRACKKCGANI